MLDKGSFGDSQSFEVFYDILLPRKLVLFRPKANLNCLNLADCDSGFSEKIKSRDIFDPSVFTYC